MSLIIPTVGQEPAPTWAEDLNTSLSLIDAHDHTSGNGAPVPSSGLNINADLTFNGASATQVTSVVFAPKLAPLTTLGSIYESGVDLYYTDGNGNQIRLTQSGSISGASGNITGLVSPAAASYVAGSKTFVWQADTNKAANLDAASIILRKLNVPSSPGITLSAPSALSSGYTMTLPPTTPSAVFSLVMDAAGNVTTNELTSLSALNLTGNITLTTGSIGLTAGDIVLTAGSIDASAGTIGAGNIIANTRVTSQGDIEAASVIYPTTDSNASLSAAVDYIQIGIPGGSSRPIVTGGGYTPVHIIAGSVNSSNTLISGGGFTSTSGGVGIHNIAYSAGSFDPSTTPTAIACVGSIGISAGAFSMTPTGCVVRTFDSGGLQAGAFQLLVIGKRDPA